VIAGVEITANQEDALIEWGIRDSKTLSARRRELLAQRVYNIAKRVEVLEISAREIDAERIKKRSLNVLEAEWMARVLNKLKWDVAYVDASDVNAERYGWIISSKLTTAKKIVSEHKADSTYPIVAAASIVAKVRRDQRIREFHQQYGDFGSGYPNDPKTRRFLIGWIRTHSEFPDIVRKSWQTARDIGAAHRQGTLND
jgi:ribonuclease HII